ncbi:MAG TPA: mechanosensitive ion channel family protein, partial [Gemmatimonadales bacterium]|nr:mechanosensitive ion channel family protein [Gemmatimonadales bacterium]
MIATAFTALTGSLADLLGSVEQFLALFGGDLETVRRKLLRTGFIWLMGLAAWYFVRIIAYRIVRHSDDGDDTALSYGEKRAQTVSGLLRGVGRIIIAVFVVILTLDTYLDIGPLLAGAGIIGLAISFGAQSLVKDVIAGFFILFEHQFDIGDVIEVAGKSGTVERMSLRVVMLRDLSGTLHTIPNGQITTVSNQTRGWSRAVVDLDIDYSDDVERALEVLRDEVRLFAADQRWSARLDGAPEVIGLQGLGNDAATIRVLLRTHPGRQWEVGREFRLRAKRRLDREGFSAPTATRSVVVRQEARARLPDDIRDAAALVTGAARPEAGGASAGTVGAGGAWVTAFPG